MSGAVIEPVARLIEAFSRLPGVGPKTAQRLTYHLLRAPDAEARQLAAALVAVRDEVVFCERCFNISDEAVCPICRDPARDARRICVVEEPQNITAVEKTREFKGVYHVLMGALSPLHGVGPDDLKIKGLLARIAAGGVEEVILATNPTVEGEATAIYLARLLKPLGLRVTRIATGIPVGSDLDYADDLTVGKALDGRREV